jgi:hypothetical protein
MTSAGGLPGGRACGLDVRLSSLNPPREGRGLLPAGFLVEALPRNPAPGAPARHLLKRQGRRYDLCSVKCAFPRRRQRGEAGVVLDSLRRVAPDPGRPGPPPRPAGFDGARRRRDVRPSSLGDAHVRREPQPARTAGAGRRVPRRGWPAAAGQRAGADRAGRALGLVPLENRILLLVCGLVVALGGSAVFVDQAAQYRFSVDSLDIEVRRGHAGNVALAAGDSLVDALMRPGHVVVRLVPG